MIPFILAAVGGYLIGDSMKSQKFSKGGMTEYAPITDGLFGVIKRNGKTFIAVDNKNVANILAKKVNENQQKADISFWIKDGINAENFISNYLKGYEIEEDEDNRVNVFNLEIVFGDYLKNKNEVIDYMIEDNQTFADGGETKSDSLKKMAEEFDNKRTNIRLKIATIIGVDKTLMYLDNDYTVSPFNLIETAVLRGFITIDEINEDVWNAALDEANDIDETYRDSGEGIGSSDMNAFVSSMLNNAGIKIIVVNNRYERA